MFLIPFAVIWPFLFQVSMHPARSRCVCGGGGGIVLCGDYLAGENSGGGPCRHPCKPQSPHCLTHTLHCRRPCISPGENCATFLPRNFPATLSCARHAPRHRRSDLEDGVSEQGHAARVGLTVVEPLNELVHFVAVGLLEGVQRDVRMIADLCGGGGTRDGAARFCESKLRANRGTIKSPRRGC